MTTLKGAIRSYGAAVRRMEREEQRRTRESARRFKEQQKLQSILDAAQAVDDYNTYVHMLKTVHLHCNEPINWTSIKQQEKPGEPIETKNKQNIAQRKLAQFSPSIFHKIFGLGPKRIQKLEWQLKEAKLYDNKMYKLDLAKYNKDLADWEALHKIALGVEKRDPEFYKQALAYFNPFGDINELGSQIHFHFKDNYIDIDFFSNNEEVIPDYELNQTSTGKMSKKNMVKTKFYELYQDHVCSCVLRIARETFAYLPVDYARVNAISKMLNSKTGYLEDQVIISVIIPPETISLLNLQSIDPSDSMQNFLHNMNFKKTVGFSVVDKIDLKK